MIESVENVQRFLDEVHKLLDENGRCTINNSPWVGKANKTQLYMAEKGLKAKDVKEVVKELRIKNYCATKDDRNSNFFGERIWEFGIRKNLVDKEEDYYIKLKIRKLEQDYLLIMSFHPEQPFKESERLEFPYKEIE